MTKEDQEFAVGRIKEELKLKHQKVLEELENTKAEDIKDFCETHDLEGIRFCDTCGKPFFEGIIWDGVAYCSVEWNKDFENIDWYKDIGNIKAQDIIEKFGKPDVIWASPDCTTYSVAAISRHRRQDLNGNLRAITEYAATCDRINSHVVDLIKELDPKYYFIENPRGGMRKMNFMKDLPRYTVTYCKYGEERMKPTDIWTNHPDPKFLPPSKNGDPDHIAAPRGSRTGTQGLKNSMERSKIPFLLCEHIVDICEE